MTTVYDVNPNQLIERVKEKLKKYDDIKPTEWAEFVKTGSHKERPPQQEDWWYIRAAAVLRSVYVHGPVGVVRLSKKFGGKKRRGVKKPKFTPASTNILRKILQQLEKAKLVEKNKRGKPGKVVSKQGRKLLDNTAHTPAK
ncbi:MAG: 30S ribosomal protein S19e [Nanoarchaeota archaeon]|nr:30S ribosomal protein S19e [Nanoarchaeota archaeon]